MSEAWQAALLGVVEGITEFLPVSSTGHLIVASDLIRFTDSGGTFEIVIQLGAVLAVVWFYRRDLWMRVRTLPSSADTRRFWRNVVVACLPAALLGFALEEFITRVLFSPVVVAVSLILGGLVLWGVDRPGRGGTGEVQFGRDGPHDVDGPGPRGLDAITLRQAFLVGLAQTAALVPGVSRSGATIVGGLLTGLDRQTATAFSFYLAMPVLGGATLYELLQNAGQIAASGRVGVFVIGLGVSFVTALLVIGWLLRFVARNDFRGFAVYRVIAGVLILLWVGLK